MEDAQYDTRIEAYVYGRLSEEEARQLEAQAKTDPQLQEQIYWHQLAYRAADLQFEDRLRSQMKEWEKERKPNVQPLRPSSRKNWWPYWAAAAAAIVLLVVGVWVGRELRPSPASAWEYASNFTPEISPLSKGSDDLASYGRGILLLRDSSYDQAIAYFDSLTHLNLDDAIIRINLAQSYFQKGIATRDTTVLKQADQLYQSLVDPSRPKDIRETADWFLILTGLVLDRAETRDKLNRIANDPDHKYWQKANELTEVL